MTTLAKRQRKPWDDPSSAIRARCRWCRCTPTASPGDRGSWGDERVAAHGRPASKPSRIAVTASFGVDVYLPTDRDDPSQFLHRADSWLFQAKANGRNQVCHAPLETHSGVSHDERELLLGN